MYGNTCFYFNFLIKILFKQSQGKLKVRETVYEGIENMRTAFFGLFKGDNTGKAIIKAS